MNTARDVLAYLRHWLRHPHVWVRLALTFAASIVITRWLLEAYVV